MKSTKIQLLSSLLDVLGLRPTASLPLPHPTLPTSAVAGHGQQRRLRHLLQFPALPRLRRAQGGSLRLRRGHRQAALAAGHEVHPGHRLATWGPRPKAFLKEKGNGAGATKSCFGSALAFGTSFFSTASSWPCWAFFSGETTSGEAPKRFATADSSPAASLASELTCFSSF